MLSKLINKYGLLLLVILFLIINIVFLNIKNIILFLSSIVMSYFIFENKTYVILFSYVISIGFGIISNFHLLENFETKEKTNDVLLEELREKNIKIKKLLKIIPSYKYKQTNMDIKLLKMKEKNNSDTTFFKNPLPKVVNAEQIKELIQSGYASEKDFPVFVTRDNYVLEGEPFVYYSKHNRMKTIPVYYLTYSYSELVRYMKLYL